MMARSTRCHSALFAAALSTITTAALGAEASPEPARSYGAPALSGYGAPSLPAERAPTANDDAIRFGRPGNLVLGVENLFGYAASNTTVTLESDFGDDVEFERGDAAFSFAGSDSNTGFMLPRIGFDGFVGGPLSIGGSITYWTGSGHALGEDAVSHSTFVFNPRVGLGGLVGPKVGLWLRLGPTWLGRTATIDSDAKSESSLTATAFTVRADVLLLPVPHFGVTIGPSFYIPLSGELETKTDAAFGMPSTTTTSEASSSAVGLHAGLIAWFGG